MFASRVDEPSESGKAHENSPAAQPAVSNSSMGQQTTFQAALTNPPVRQWKIEWLEPAPLIRATVLPVPIDEVRLQRIKNTSQAQHGIWEIDAFYTPNPVDGDNRPFFPYTFLCADQSRVSFRDASWLNHRLWQPEFCKAFLEGHRKHKLLPKRIVGAERRTTGAV